MITCTTSITILRRETTFSRFKQSKSTILQKQLLYWKINFFFQNHNWRLHLKNPIKTRKIKELLPGLDWNARWQVKLWGATSSLSLTFSLFGSVFNLVHLVIMVDKPGCGHTWHVSQEPLGHLVEMEPKETWVARGKLGPRDHLVLTERKEQRESLGSRVPPDKKESEGTKATVERHDWLHIWTGRSALGKRHTAQIQDWYM